MASALKVAASTEFKIDSGITIPTRGRHQKYPFAQMSVGDSFAFPRADGSKIRAAANHHQRNGAKFSIRNTPTESRCWRTA